MWKVIDFSMSNQENSNGLLYLCGELKVRFDSCVLSCWNVLFQVEVTLLPGFKLYTSLLCSGKATRLDIGCF